MKFSNILTAVIGGLFGFLLMMGVFGLVNKAHAILPDEFGWDVTVKNKQGKATAMAVTGEEGGVLTFACDVKTKKIKMGYSHTGMTYDFFVVRKFGSLSVDSMAGKLMIGSGVHKQGDLYYNVLNNDKAFVVTRFPLGSKHAWEEAVRLNLDAGPDIEQEGEEFFIVGDRQWKTWLKEISEACPVK